MEPLDIIVLGQFLNDFDARYNPMLIPATYKSRLDKAVEIYRKHIPRPRIIITGEDPADLAVSEARVGLNYLLAQYGKDFPDLASNVVLEEKAQTTTQNAVYTKRILLAGGSRTPIVISSDFHMERVESIFRFVYGLEFHPVFVAASSGLHPAEFARLTVKYRKKGEDTLQWFKEEGIEPGEHEKIFELVKWTGKLSG